MGKKNKQKTHKKPPRTENQSAFPEKTYNLGSKTLHFSTFLFFFLQPLPLLFEDQDIIIILNWESKATW